MVLHYIPTLAEQFYKFSFLFIWEARTALSLFHTKCIFLYISAWLRLFCILRIFFAIYLSKSILCVFIIIYISACLKLYVTASLLNTNIRTKSLIHCLKEGACKYIIVDDGKSRGCDWWVFCIRRIWLVITSCLTLYMTSGEHVDLTVIRQRVLLHIHYLWISSGWPANHRHFIRRPRV